MQLKIIQAGLDFYRVDEIDPTTDVIDFLATYPIRRPTLGFQAERIEESRARTWFEGWAAERGFIPEFVQ